MRQSFASLWQMTRDIAANIQRIFVLAQFEYRVGTKDYFLGGIWNVISPFVQIGIYWLVFGIGLRNGAPVDGIPYVVWLTCGVTPWYWLNGCISKSSASVYAKASMLTRSNIPTCLIPLSSVLATSMSNIWNIIWMLVIYIFNGCVPTLSAFGLLYYIFCGWVFLSVCSLITSALVMLARDFQKLIDIFMRFMFFLSPIFWNPGSSLSGAFQLFNSCNPFGYVICGFRNSLLYDVSELIQWKETAIFWGIVLVLYWIGGSFQEKVRKNLLDYL
ncbi:ABC-2 type transporter [uncultured Flavonifractor sp.]|nr:ABC-2 type transporter [uncultured Flavonifractor sp.]